MRSVRSGVQPVSSQNSSMHDCVASPGFLGVLGGRQGDGAEDGRPRSERREVSLDPVDDLGLMVDLVQRRAHDDEVVGGGVGVGRGRDLAEVDLEAVGPHGLRHARGDLGGVPVRARVDEEGRGAVGGAIC